MPGDDFLIDDDAEFDPLEGMEPIAGTPDGEPETKPPSGTPAEVTAAWNAMGFQPTEAGSGDGYTFQRLVTPDQKFAKVIFTFTDQPPPHDQIERCAGMAWVLDTTQVKGKTITAFYARR